MKTKIIYISGSEVFEMAQIRTAFDQVRTTLGLGTDTVLFGVPVDADDTLECLDTVPTVAEVVVAQTGAEQENVAAEHMDQINEFADCADIPMDSDDNVINDVAPDVVDMCDSPQADSDLDAPDVILDENNDLPRVTDDASADRGCADDDKVIPILSILSAQDEDVAPIAQDNIPPMSTTAVTDTDFMVESDVVDTDVVVEPVVTDSVTDMNADAPEITESISIGDMLQDAILVDSSEQTLEELLESMTPLGEDVIPAPVDITDPETGKIPELNVSNPDATLAQLASEFAKTEDKIKTVSRPENQGKIGKLKNILPIGFKKQHREDTGIIGDLFGWAGIAANDEDFSIPGFFTPAASKKQGA